MCFHAGRLWGTDLFKRLLEFVLSLEPHTYRCSEQPVEPKEFDLKILTYLCGFSRIHCGQDASNWVYYLSLLPLVTRDEVLPTSYGELEKYAKRLSREDGASLTEVMSERSWADFVSDAGESELSV